MGNAPCNVAPSVCFLNRRGRSGGGVRRSDRWDFSKTIVFLRGKLKIGFCHLSLIFLAVDCRSGTSIQKLQPTLQHGPLQT